MSRPDNPADVATAAMPPYSSFADAYAAGSELSFSRALSSYVAESVFPDFAPVGSVADLACGLGGACEAFARQGLRVFGIDASARMLDHARASASESGLKIEYLCQDMRELTLPVTVDALTCMYDPLNFMTYESDLETVFRRVRRSLRTGGCFVFDIYTIHGLEHYWGTQDEIHTIETDYFVASRTAWNPERSTNTKTLWGFSRENGSWTSWTERHTVRAYPLSTVEQLLETAGFRVARLREWRDGGAFDPGPTSVRVLYVAEALASPPARES